jgi:hypothetical protein
MELKKKALFDYYCDHVLFRIRVDQRAKYKDALFRVLFRQAPEIDPSEATKVVYHIDEHVITEAHYASFSHFSFSIGKKGFKEKGDTQMRTVYVKYIPRYERVIFEAAATLKRDDYWNRIQRGDRNEKKTGRINLVFKGYRCKISIEPHKVRFSLRAQPKGKRG